MSRFTIKDLREGIGKLNLYLADAGALVRFEVGGAYGYQEVYKYKVNATGKRLGSGVNGMIGSGSPRETYQESYDNYLSIVRKMTTNKIAGLKAFVERPDCTIEEVRNLLSEID